MNCPNCDAPIPEQLIAKHFASKGGKASRRSLDSETARQMVEARSVKGVVERLEAGGFEHIVEPRGALAIKSTPEVSEIIFPIAPLLESFRDPDGSIWYRLKRRV